MTGDITTLELHALDGLRMFVHLDPDPDTHPAGVGEATRQAHAAGRWQYITITVHADLPHIDLRVSRSSVAFGTLPGTGRIDVAHLMNVDPVPQLVAEYRAQLAALTVRLAGLDLGTPTLVPLALSTEDLSRLRTWLGTAQRRWQGTTDDAEAAAARPAPQRVVRPGHLNIEPLPAGYRAIGHPARAELARIDQFGKRLDKLARLANAAEETSR